jgi:hypothetical protein
LHPHDLALGRQEQIGELVGRKIGMGRDLAGRAGPIEQGDSGLELLQSLFEQGLGSLGVRVHRLFLCMKGDLIFVKS